MDSSSAAAGIKYVPLRSADHIRLIILKRGSGADPINTSIIQTVVGNEKAELAYEALSYEWGSAGATELSILFDGGSITVRQNLYNALLNIRLPHQDRRIWIDALCINQSDPKERGHQVQMMGRIYRHAQQVVAWLGPAANDSDLAMDTITSLGQLALRLFDDAGYILHLRQLLDIAALQALVVLCTREYWHRIWIVQEIRLARKLEWHCGTKSTTGKVFELAFWHVRQYDTGPEPHKMVLANLLRESIAYSGHIEKRVTRQSRDNGFHHWVFHCIERGFRSSEPRDMIYAVLGLCDDIDENALLPDYEKDIGELFVDALVLCGRRKSTGDMFATMMPLASLLGIESSKAVALYKRAGKLLYGGSGLYSGEKLADYFAWLSMIVEEEESKEEEDAAKAEQSGRNTHRYLTL